MKLNEKNLVAMASASNLSVDKEGYLNKRGEVNKSFRKRWFVLKGNLLYYFEKKIDKEPVGVIIVEGCTVGELSLPLLHEDDNGHLEFLTWSIVF